MTTRILNGDCRAVLPTLPAGSVHCVVTSPPYFGLRSYLPEGHPDKALEIGSEATPDAFVAALVEVFREVRRVLRDDGTLWLNIGDSYSTHAAGKVADPMKKSTLAGVKNATIANRAASERTDAEKRGGIPEKNLLGIPWLLAFALRADGWYLRRDIIWSKPNPMPESVEDRPSSAHEYLFLLTKRPSYFYDGTAIVEDAVSDHPSGNGFKRDARLSYKDANGARGSDKQWSNVGGTRASRSVWTIATQPYSGAHFATMAPKLAERCILAGTSERGACPACGAPWRRLVAKERTFEANTVRAGNEPRGKHGDRHQGGGETKDIRRGPVVHATTTGWAPGCTCPEQPPVPCVVLDPFGGAGTTGLVADRLQRDAVLIELNPASGDLARNRVLAAAPLLAKVV